MEHLAEYILASSIVLLALQENLAPGQLVVLADGIYGKIVRVGKETVDLEFKSGVAEVARYAIARVIA